MASLDGQTKTEPSDEALASLVKQRDVAAFSLLYERYVPSIYGFAAHLLGLGDAEEVVQEVFVRLWRRAEQFDPARGSFRSWFMASARHRILDELKRRNQERTLVAVGEIDQLLSRVIDHSGDIESGILLDERNDALIRALQELPAEQRQAILLAYFGGFSQSSIARLLNWPLGTVKKRTRLGLQKLRASLAEEIAAKPQIDPSETRIA